MPEIKAYVIPQAIWLNAQRVAVEFRDDLIHKEGCLGHAAFREMAIRIQGATKGRPRFNAEIEVTFFHELIHWILHCMGEEDLGVNEKFVDTMARLLHQAIVMAEFE